MQRCNKVQLRGSQAYALGGRWLFWHMLSSRLVTAHILTTIKMECVTGMQTQNQNGVHEALIYVHDTYIYKSKQGINKIFYVTQDWKITVFLLMKDKIDMHLIQNQHTYPDIIGYKNKSIKV